jgi:hypothetical protein
VTSGENDHEGDYTTSPGALIIVPGPSGRLYRSNSAKLGHNESHSFIQKVEPDAPKVLYRSKTGKGIAYAGADIDFLLRLLSFRRFVQSPTTRSGR